MTPFHDPHMNFYAMLPGIFAQDSSWLMNLISGNPKLAGMLSSELKGTDLANLKKILSMNEANQSPVEPVAPAEPKGLEVPPPETPVPAADNSDECVPSPTSPAARLKLHR